MRKWRLLALLVIALGIFSLPSITIRPVHATDPGWNGSGKVTLDQYSGNAPKVVYVPPGIGSDTEFMFFLSATGTCGTNPQTYTILLITSSNEFQSHSSVDQSPFCAQPFSTGGSLDAAFDPATNLIYLIFVDTTGIAQVSRVSPSLVGSTHFSDSTRRSTGQSSNSPSITYDPIAGLLLASNIFGSTQCNGPNVLCGPINVAKSTDGITWTNLGQATADISGPLTATTYGGASIRYSGTYAGSPPNGAGVHIIFVQSNFGVMLAHTCVVTSSQGFSCYGAHDLGIASTNRPIALDNPTQSAALEPEFAWTGTDSGGHINVMENAQPKTVLSETAFSGPDLAFIANKNKFLLSWRGTDCINWPFCAPYNHLNVEPQNALTDGASYVSQTAPPSTMCTGQTAQVSITMQNTGTAVWAIPSADPNPFRLGSQNPQDNTVWGFSRVEIAALTNGYSPSLPGPGTQWTFSFTVTAPSSPGTYNFQWRMVQEGVTWFGDYTPNVQVNVHSCSVTIRIVSYPTTDYYTRSHGLAIDTPLPNPWWPPYQSGYEFLVTGSQFDYSRTVTLTLGSHYVQEAASGYVPNYAWHTKIYINGVLTAEGDVGRTNPLQANFNV